MNLQRIRDLREEADYTQEYVAHLLHTSQRTYSRYENEERSIPLSTLCFLADLYETNVDYLIGQTDVRIPYPASKDHTYEMASVQKAVNEAEKGAKRVYRRP